MAAEGERQQQRHHRGDDQGRADEVDLALRLVGHLRHLHDDHEQRQQRERQVQVEDPPPARDHMARQAHRAVVGEIAADQRADGAGKPEHGAEHAADLAPFARRVEVADDRKGCGEQRAAADALDGAEDDKLHHAATDQRQGSELAREPRQPRTRQEDADAGQQHGLSSVEVAELSPDRHHHRRAQQVGRGHPGIEREAVQFGDDPRHGSRHDGLVQRRQQEDDGDAPKRHTLLKIGEFDCAHGWAPSDSGSFIAQAAASGRARVSPAAPRRPLRRAAIRDAAPAGVRR
jgi:hypothetical protein